MTLCNCRPCNYIMYSVSEKDDEPSKEKFTFEDFMSRKYAPKSFSFTWLTGKNSIQYHLSIH